MTPAQAIAEAFPGSDPTITRARLALQRLIHAVTTSEQFAQLAIDWAAMCVEDPSLTFTEGDLPEAANSLAASLHATANLLTQARNAFITLRFEYRHYLEAKHGASQPEIPQPTRTDREDEGMDAG